MTRQLIAGLLIALAVGGCAEATQKEPTSPGEPRGATESDERAKGPGDPCGGFAGVKCKDGLYCDFPTATSCGSGDQMGACKAPPDVCTQISSPVCGCDGKTYGNTCEASRASTSVRHDGECK